MKVITASNKKRNYLSLSAEEYLIRSEAMYEFPGSRLSLPQGKYFQKTSGVHASRACRLFNRLGKCLRSVLLIMGLWEAGIPLRQTPSPRLPKPSLLPDPGGSGGAAGCKSEICSARTSWKKPNKYGYKKVQIFHLLDSNYLRLTEILEYKFHFKGQIRMAVLVITRFLQFRHQLPVSINPRRRSGQAVQ